MKKSAARVFCAIALMATALASSVGLMGAVFAENEVPPQRIHDTSASGATEVAVPLQTNHEVELVLVRMLFVADPDIKQIRICTPAGESIQTLTPDEEGMAVSEPLTPGSYYAITGQGPVAFTLHENASVTANSGCGWSDGEVLHLTTTQVGSVCVQRSISPGELESSDGWLDYTLSNTGYYAREVVWCEGSNSTVLSCTFYGVPYGSYVLRENGEPCAEVTIGAEALDVAVSLPAQ